MNEKKTMSSFFREWHENHNRITEPEVKTFNIYKITNTPLTKIKFYGHSDKELVDLYQSYEDKYKFWDNDKANDKRVLIPYMLVGCKPKIEIIEKYTGTIWQLSERLAFLVRHNDTDLNFYFDL